MKSDVIEVSTSQDNTDLVLETADRVAGYYSLPEKSAMYLRLLTEEMMGMVRAIAGEVTGEFWIESEDGKEFALHLKVWKKMDQKAREQLIAASTTGTNEAHRGFMGKIRAFFEPLDDMPLLLEMGSGEVRTDLTWSMKAYQEQLEEDVRQNKSGAKEAWDALERSVVAHVADEVKVRIDGYDVEMTAYKKVL